MSRATNPSSAAVDDVDSAQLLLRLKVTQCDIERAELIEELVVRNERFCHALAAQFSRKGAEWEDLSQVAQTALLLAIRRFEPARGTSFHAFAAPTIIGELKRYLRDHCWAARPPRRLQELRVEIRSVGDDLTQRLGHAPTAEEMAQALGVTAANVREATAADGAFRAVSLDLATEHGEVGANLEPASFSGAGVGGVDELLDCLILRGLLKKLTRRERQLLLWRFRDECTQTTIASRLGISQMQVSRILTRLLSRLRQALVDPGPADASPQGADGDMPVAACARIA